MTYGELYNYALNELGITENDVADYRPAAKLFIPELEAEQIENAIIIWLKSGDRIVYMKKYTECQKCHAKWNYTNETNNYKFCPFCGGTVEV